jgi:hypothetical protein
VTVANGTPGTEPTGFLYPFIEEEENDLDGLLEDPGEHCIDTMTVCLPGLRRLIRS